jgi:hypothetical protein
MESPENYEKCGESVQRPVGGWPLSLHRSKHARGGHCVWHRGKHLREIPRDTPTLIASIACFNRFQMDLLLKSMNERRKVLLF